MYITTSTNKTDRTPRRAMVSFSNACEGVKMKLAKASDISLDVDPDGVTPDKVNVTENDDGTFTANLRKPESLFLRKSSAVL